MSEFFQRRDDNDTSKTSNYDFGTEIATFRLNTWRYGSWGLQALLCLGTGPAGALFLFRGEWIPAVVLLTVSGGTLAWWIRIAMLDRQTIPLRIFSKGFVYDDVTTRRVVAFADVVAIREEVQTFGVGPWNKEAICRIEMRGGTEIWIGRRVLRSDRVAGIMRQTIGAMARDPGGEG